MKKKSLKILSYNIHKGFAFIKPTFILRAMKEALHTTGVDIVFLQEVVGEDKRRSRKVSNWPTVSQYEFLADSLWPHHQYGKNAVFQGGHHGNAILSRYPFMDWSNINISTNRFEKRGLLLGTIHVTELETTVHLACVHLGLTQRGRMIQLKKICDVLKALPEDAPLILAGDFNDWEKKASKKLRESLNLVEVVEKITGQPAVTFPAKMPFMALDRIYVRGCQIAQASPLHGKKWSKLSDHSPICAEVNLIGV